MGKRYASGKVYGHEVGLSCAFRQWRAESHCRFLHGYALKFKFQFSSTELDVRQWVVDFGGLKSLKGLLEDTFDHKTLVAVDDPMRRWFNEAHDAGIMDVVVVDACGCEATAKLVYEVAEQHLKDMGYDNVQLDFVAVYEHGANYAVYGNDQCLGS